MLAATLLAVASFASCGGGGSSGTPALPSRSAPPAPVLAQDAISIPLSDTGVAIPLPGLPGINGTITLPPNDAPSGANLSIGTSASLPPFVSGAPQSGSVTFLAIELESSQNVTFHGLPKFVVTLSGTPANRGAYFAWMFDQSKRWSNFAMLSVSGDTLTFGSGTGDLTLIGGVPIAIIPLTASAGASCPTPVPTATPVPTPTPKPTPTPVPTPVPTPIGNPLYVARDFDILVFSATASGNVPPSSIMYNSQGIIALPQQLALAHHELFVTNALRFPPFPNPFIDAFAPVTTADGKFHNVDPVRLIIGNGPTDNPGQIEYPSGIAVDATDQLYVTDEFGATGPTAAIHVYASDAGTGGSIVPIRTIVGDRTGLGPPNLDEPRHAIALDNARGLMYVSNKLLNTVTVYPTNADGNVAPLHTISGAATGLHSPVGVALNRAGDVYVASYTANRIDVFSPGSDGNAAPIRTIAGPLTRLNFPRHLAFDTLGNLYVGNEFDTGILVFAPGTSGNAAPIRSIAGDKTRMQFTSGIAVDR